MHALPGGDKVTVDAIALHLPEQIALKVRDPGTSHFIDVAWCTLA